MPEHFPNIYLRGMHFRGQHAKDYVDSLEPGQPLWLKREPDNQFDPNAIQVWTRPIDETLPDTQTGEPIPTGFHFAFVQGEMTSWIAPLLDDGIELIAIVEGVDRTGKTAYPVVTIQEPAA